MGRPFARGERGSIAPAVPVIAMFLLLLGGLVIDASRQLNARGEAVAFAEEAARAGAQGVDIAADDLVLDPALVRERVEAYCRRVLQLGQVTDCRMVGEPQPVSNTDPRALVVRDSRRDADRARRCSASSGSAPCPPRERPGRAPTRGSMRRSSHEPEEVVPRRARINGPN